jgi:mRNA interferase HigB
MKIRLIRKETIEEFVTDHAHSRPSFANWLAAIKHADWRSPYDIKQTFGSADLLGMGSNRVVFDIGGNNYRLVCKYAFGERQVHLFVCWIGTHGQYDKLCNDSEQYTITDY